MKSLVHIKTHWRQKIKPQLIVYETVTKSKQVEFHHLPLHTNVKASIDFIYAESFHIRFMRPILLLRYVSEILILHMKLILLQA